MLSVNGWNSGLVACSWVTCRSCKGRLAKGWLPEGEETIVRRCLTQEQMRKGRYESNVRKGSLGNCKWGRVFWTTDLKKCKTTDLVRESKRRFELVVRLIANECYEDTFYFLSFLSTVLTLPSLVSHTCLMFLHWIICEIIWLARSYLELSTSAEFFVTLRARPEVQTSETR